MVVAASGGGGGGWAETFALGRVSRVEARSKTRGGGEKKACGGDGADETFLTLSFYEANALYTFEWMSVLVPSTTLATTACIYIKPC